jgi:hypothetical protein
MATIKQLPAVLDLEGVAGEPLRLRLTVTGGHTVSSPTVVLRTGSGAASAVAATIDQDGNVFTVTWDADDMAALNTGTRVAKDYLYAFRARVNGDGPYGLVARSLLVHPAGTADIATEYSASLEVTVGGVEVTLPIAIAIDGAGALDLDGGAPDEVYADADTIDGGDPDDEQTETDIDGGTL